MKRAIYWFRNDLRTTDNPAFAHAVKACDEVIPVYVFDDFYWSEDRWGMKKTGVHRTRFLIESVADLRASLESLGGRLFIAKGSTSAVLRDLAGRFNCSEIFAQAEHTREEKDIEREVAELLPLTLIEGLTMIHPEDIPMPVDQLPDIFTQFRKKVEKYSEVRGLVKEPKALQVPDLPHTELPKLADFGFEATHRDERAVLQFEGGAHAAWKRLDHYLWDTQSLSTYKETRNGLIGADYSSKFSPWLANGSLSPREIYAEVKRYEADHGANQSTYWLIFELLWRDYFRFVAMKYGDRLFHRSGIKGSAPKRRMDERVFSQWASGQTKEAFVNANMRELVLTGFMSNRGRQNVASYFVHDLGMDWRLGASFFEHHLIDYDVASNYGNWIYVAGVGNDPRESRKFNIARQQEMYDREGAYIRLWE